MNSSRFGGSAWRITGGPLGIFLGGSASGLLAGVAVGPVGILLGGSASRLVGADGVCLGVGVGEAGQRLFADTGLVDAQLAFHVVVDVVVVVVHVRFFAARLVRVADHLQRVQHCTATPDADV